MLVRKTQIRTSDFQNFSKNKKALKGGYNEMKITNRTLITWLNGIIEFAKAERDNGKALLTAKGEYAVVCNKKILTSADEVYLEALEKVKDDKDEVIKLLDTEIEIPELRTVGMEDFRDGITVDIISALEFMTV